MVCYIFLSLFLATDFSFRLLNIYLNQLINLFYIKNIYYISILIILILFSCILVRQGLNYFNTLPIKNNSAQATYFITVGSPSSLLVILILIYIRNPLNLQASPKKYSTNSIFVTDFINRRVQVLKEDLYQFRINTQDIGLIEPIELQDEGQPSYIIKLSTCRSSEHGNVSI